MSELSDVPDLASDDSRAEVYANARPPWGDPEYRIAAALFNDITRAPASRHVMFSDRKRIADYLWAQGWRREFRPDDVTERRK